MPYLRRRSRWLLGCAVVASAAYLAGVALDAYGETWDGVVLAVAVVLWIAHLNAAIHSMIKDEIKLRVDRLQDELSDQQERNTRVIIHEITTSEARDRFVHEVAQHLAARGALDEDVAPRDQGSAS